MIEELDGSMLFDNLVIVYGLNFVDGYEYVEWNLLMLIVGCGGGVIDVG